MAGIIIFLAIAVGTKTPYNLISLAGFVTFILLLFLFSHNPAKVSTSYSTCTSIQLIYSFVI